MKSIVRSLVAAAALIPAAVFGQAEWSVTDRLRVLPGLRFNYDAKNVNFDQQVYGGLQTTNAALIALQRSVLLVEGMPRLAAPPIVFSNTMAAVMAAHRQRHNGSRWLPFFSLLAAALSVATLTLCVSVGGESLADALEQRPWAPDQGDWSYLAGIDALLLRSGVVPERPLG